MLYIDGIRMPNPTKYEVQLSDLDSSETTRNEQGVLLRNRVRQGVSKIALSWTAKTAVVKTVLAAIQPAQVEVKFFHPEVGEYKTATMYASDRSCPLRLYTDDMSPSDALWDLSFNLIEF